MTPMPKMPTPIAPETAALINKGLAVLAIAAFLAAAATILPSFQPSAAATPQVSGTPAQKSVAWADPACAEQNWPNFDRACLSTSNRSSVSQVRLVTTDKL